MEKLLTCLVLITGLIIPFAGKSQAYTENFDDITTLTGNGWFMQNNSSPVGSNWFQGIATTANPEPFISYNGAVNSYIAANFSSTGGGIGTISNWLITPNRTIRNGDVFTFYTRKPTISSGQTDYPDRLEVRMSTNGASTNAGADAGETGDFSTLLLSINPTLVADVYPQVWTKYTITISGLPAPTSGRIAFRYFVTSAGSLGSNSDYIGIDNVVYTPYTCPAFTMTTGGMLTGGVAGSSYSASLAQTGALGTPNFAITAGALPPGVTLATNGTISGTPTATGTFNFTVTVSDASGCSGAQSYSITVVCPANPITLAASPALCDNGSAYTLIEGSPAGGTYNGTGVTAGQFDPSSGSQAITYDYTDPYGCVYSSNYTITVNTAPTVTQSAISVCDNSGTFVLIGGLPAGGVYSGTGVTAGEFDPSAGTQTITYTYTDANGCVSEATETITVNTASTVTQSAISVCDNSGTFVLIGGLPAGGVYSGTGVTAGEFDPSAGPQTITYTYTDANGCVSEAMETITVNTAPTVTQSAISVCDNSGTFVLIGGLPAGGVYSGTGVTAGEFDPSAGTQTITYTYTDANGCVSEAMETITVNAAPTVTQSAISVCDNSGTFVLIGGLPAGGVYSGTGVTAGEFDPSAGPQTITYTYTDANGCVNEATETITVNTAPIVTQSAISAVCDNSGVLVLTGGLPAGGVYSGTGVTAGEFDPSAGTQTITYTYTDANGCVNEATETVIVNVVPDVAVTLSGTTLTVTQTSAAYQWIDCENNPIAGATNQSFTATVNGDYAVIIENEYGCADTSACYNINTVGIKSLEQNEWSMYPNPSAGNIHIRSSVSGNFTVINNLGQELIRFDVQAGIENIVSLIHLPDGVYFIKGTESAVSTIAQKLIIRK